METAAGEHIWNILLFSDIMEDDEAVKHLFLENGCEGYESSEQFEETPQFLDKEDPQIHGKRIMMCMGWNVWCLIFLPTQEPSFFCVNTRAVESDFKKSNKSRMPKSF